jgi:nucleoside-diphosphate-sugar epimerase
MATIVVTGAAGAIGRPACDELLRRGHHVRGFDRTPTPWLDDAVAGDLLDREAVRAAVRGADSVVHLAAEPDDADFSVLEGPNVTGLFHVLDAARREGLSRVVLASSIQVLGTWWEPGARPASTAYAAPINHYGLTKVWAEQMGEMYARVYGLSVIAARIAFMVRSPEEARRLARRRLFDTYLSRGDVGRFFAAAIEAPAVDFAVLYAVGAGGERLFDMEPTARLLGFAPRDRWPEGLGFAPPLEE